MPRKERTCLTVVGGDRAWIAAVLSGSGLNPD